MTRLILDLTDEQMDVLDRALISYGVKHAEARDRARTRKQPDVQAEHDHLVQVCAEVSAAVQQSVPVPA